MLTGRLLYSGTSRKDLLEQMELRPFIPEPEMSEFISSLISRCLHLDYQKRFRNFEEVIKFIATKGTDKAKNRPETASTKSKTKEKENDVITSGNVDKANSPNHHKSKTGIDMIAVQGGSFMMGSDDEEAFDGEKPVHRVTVSDFYIGKYEVTQEQYEKVMGKNPSYFQNSGKNAPVEQVSWYEAVEFCNKLSEMEGLQKCYHMEKGGFLGLKKNITCNFSANGYRLPTEAEWEYAAKGGSKSKGYKYSGSNNLDEVGWYYQNSGDSSLSGDWDANKIIDNNCKTHTVGGKKANELGIYDMSGNVWEWCWDWYGDYSSSAQTNPHGEGSGSGRVERGGSWYYNARFCRTADRYSFNPTYGSLDIGFRLSRANPY
jgi:formylglycine-generating enzyme